MGRQSMSEGRVYGCQRIIIKDEKGNILSAA